jgi:hypothetical protein
MIGTLSLQDILEQATFLLVSARKLSARRCFILF